MLRGTRFLRDLRAKQHRVRIVTFDVEASARRYFRGHRTTRRGARIAVVVSDWFVADEMQRTDGAVACRSAAQKLPHHAPWPARRHRREYKQRLARNRWSADRLLVCLARTLPDATGIDDFRRRRIGGSATEGSGCGRTRGQKTHRDGIWTSRSLRPTSGFGRAPLNSMTQRPVRLAPNWAQHVEARARGGLPTRFYFPAEMPPPLMICSERRGSESSEPSRPKPLGPVKLQIAEKLFKTFGST